MRKSKDECIGHHCCQCVGQRWRGVERAVEAIDWEIRMLQAHRLISMPEMVRLLRVMSAAEAGKPYKKHRCNRRCLKLRQAKGRGK